MMPPLKINPSVVVPWRNLSAGSFATSPLPVKAPARKSLGCGQAVSDLHSHRGVCCGGAGERCGEGGCWLQICRQIIFNSAVRVCPRCGVWDLMDPRHHEVRRAVHHGHGIAISYALRRPVVPLPLIVKRGEGGCQRHVSGEVSNVSSRISMSLMCRYVFETLAGKPSSLKMSTLAIVSGAGLAGLFAFK